MNVAMLHTPIIRRGGGIRQLLMLARGLRERGHGVTIYTEQVAPERTFTDLLDGLDIRTVPCAVPAKFRTPRYRYYGDLLRMVKIGRAVEGTCDVINPHNFPTEWAAYVAKKRTGAPVVWMCNEPPFFFGDTLRPAGRQYLREWPLFSLWDRFAVSRCIDEAVVLSENAAALVRRAYGRSAKIIRSGTGEPINVIARAAAREKAGLGPDEFAALQVGFVIPHKRVSDSLKALAATGDESVRIVFVGEGDLRRYRAEAAALGVEGRAVFTGPIPDAELASWTAAADVFLYPAEQTWGLAAAEAMACGMPVIASKGNGFSEVIAEGETGFTFTPGDTGALADCIMSLKRNPALRDAMGARAREFVRERLSWPRYVAQMEKVFEEAVAGRKKKR